MPPTIFESGIRVVSVVVFAPLDALLNASAPMSRAYRAGVIMRAYGETKRRR
jgi:hypothetical protein